MLAQQQHQKFSQASRRHVTATPTSALAAAGFRQSFDEDTPSRLATDLVREPSQENNSMALTMASPGVTGVTRRRLYEVRRRRVELSVN